MNRILSFLAILALLAPVPASALTFRFGENYSLKDDEKIVGDMYVAGGNTAVGGKVSGDLFIAGANVFVRDSIEEDVVAVGGTINIFGDIGKDLRVAGGNVVVAGLVGDSAVIAGGDIKVLPQSVIAGDAAFAGGQIILDGSVGGDVKIAGGEVQINDSISGNAYITGNRIIIGDTANIGGNLVYSSSRPAVISDKAHIGGEITFNETQIRLSAEKFLPTLWGTWIFIKLVMLLVAALLLNVIFRNISVKFVGTALNSFWKSLLRGFLVLVATPVAVVLLMATFVAAPFVILGISALAILVTLSWVYGAIVIGSLVRRLIRKDKLNVVNWKTIVVGVLTVFLIGYVPYLELPIKTIFMMVSLGAIWHVFYEKFTQVR